MFENLKTVILLSVLSVIMIIIFGFIGSIFNIGSLGLTVGLLIAIVMNFMSYFKSDSIALRAYNAQIVSEQESPNLHMIVGDLANRAGIKKPRIAVIQSSEPNAFATGRNQDHAVVAVTTGILQLLNEDELRGVISHELGHIKNKDILISSVAATIGALISYTAYMARWAFIFSDNDNMGNVISGILISIIGPLTASIIQLAISRSREYRADATGAEICGNPLALASALRKIEFGLVQNPMNDARPTDAHMFIMNPFGNAASSLKKLFATHPPTADRIMKLEEMAGAKLQ
ncbi:MAG: protease [Methanosphaera stadtmanae]|jgi:heat shock protein HtpX|nr:protease [Methanosphaera stadtmanae]